MSDAEDNRTKRRDNKRKRRYQMVMNGKGLLRQLEAQAYRHWRKNRADPR